MATTTATKKKIPPKINKALSSLESLYEFYKEIPQEKWAEGTLRDSEYDPVGDKYITTYCALGHLGYGNKDERDDIVVERLDRLFGKSTQGSSQAQYITDVNDGEKYSYLKNPRSRILVFIKNKLKRKTK